MGYSENLDCTHTLHIQLFSFLWPLTLAYFIWLYYDWDSPKRGAYRSIWFMRQRIHKWYANYFPVKLHKTEDLDPNEVKMTNILQCI